MSLTKLAPCLVLFSALTACGGDVKDSKQAVQEGGACPENSAVLKGTKGAGEACGTATDCKPVTCSCPSPKTNQWCGVQCQAGKCASDPCPATRDDARYCGE